MPAQSSLVTGGFGVFANERAKAVSITYNRFERHNGAGIFFADRNRPPGICSPPVDDPDDPDDHGKGRGKKHKKKHRPDPCGCKRHPKAF